MKPLLAVTAVSEAVTGLALLAYPPMVVHLLFGAEIAGVGVVISRIAGAALLAIGVACGLTRTDPDRPTQQGLLISVLIYDIAAAALLAYAGLFLDIAGIALWPVVVLHAALAAWCIVCILVRPNPGSGGTPIDPAERLNTAPLPQVLPAMEKDPVPTMSDTTWKLDRLASASDALIAIAMTVLVLGLEMPSPHRVPTKDLHVFLIDSLHSVFAYVNSFVLIGIYWLQHNVIFRHLSRANLVLVVLNGLFLLCVSFIPFPTGLQAAYREDNLAVLLFGVSHLMCGLSLLAMWFYATQWRRLVAAELAPAVVRSTALGICIVPMMSVLGMAGSFISDYFGRTLFLIAPLIFYLGVVLANRARLKLAHTSEGAAPTGTK